MARTAALWAGRAHARSKWGVLSPAASQPSGSPIDGGTGGPIGLTVEIFVNNACVSNAVGSLSPRSC